MIEALLGAWFHATTAMREVLTLSPRPGLMSRVLHEAPPQWVKIITNVSGISALCRAPPPSAASAMKALDQARCNHQDMGARTTIKRFGNAYGSFQK